MKFKVGNKVRIVQSGNSNLVGMVGKIDSIALDRDIFGQLQYVIVFPDGCFVVMSKCELEAA
jgi:hypothetical protein